jgi:hypothetical protein
MRIQKLGRVVVMLAVVCAVAGGCLGKTIDRECIRGRLSAEQADEINNAHWGKLPSYNRGEDGKCIHCAAVDDRILAAECSEFLKEVTFDY